MKPLDIDDEFEDFMRNANPTVAATTAQYRESRRVFFAGIASLFWQLVKLTAEPDEVGMKEMDSIKRQLEALSLRVKKEAD